MQLLAEEFSLPKYLPGGRVLKLKNNGEWGKEDFIDSSVVLRLQVSSIIEVEKRCSKEVWV